MGYEVVLLRHGETTGYDGDHGLTPLGERQARERGTALAAQVEPGTAVRMPHARTTRAVATAVALRAALVAALGDDGRVGPLVPEPWFDNLRFARDGEAVDTSGAVTARLAITDGELPDWAREYDRFDTDYRAAAAAGNPIEYWMHNPTLYFEPPHLAAHRVWRGIFAAAEGHDEGRPLMVLAATHSAPMRAFVATALGFDAGEPRNLEDVRARVVGTRVEVSFREHTVAMTEPSLPPWIDSAWLAAYGR